MKRTRGFTLIELLVVVAIITALIAILLPSLNKAMSLAQTAVCMSQQKQIHTASTSYLATNRLQYPPRRNWGRWYDVPANATPIDPLHGQAYWGVAYADEIGFDAGRPLFKCPEALASDMNTSTSNPGNGNVDGTFEDGHVFSTYGFNGLRRIYAVAQGATSEAPYFVDSSSSGYPGTTLASIRNPASIIMFQDAFEHYLDGNGDMPWSFTQWTSTQNREYFRHNLNTGSNVAFGDGHIETIDLNADWNIFMYAGN